jgi:hypothetical protein
VDTTRADRERLAEAEYLIESLRAATLDYQERVWDLEERSRNNYYHLCHLGGQVYEEQTVLPGPARFGSVPTSGDWRSWRRSQHCYHQRRGHDCERRPLSYPRHFFHHYASTREALWTRLRWTALSRTSETTTEGQ